jgi:hypothetical protein
MTYTLFGNIWEQGVLSNSLGPGTAILRGFALEREALLLDALFAVAARSYFRHMVTPGGFHMSVAMTNCGSLGWVTDRKGYRYDSVDPETQAQWPPMPKPFMELAQNAAKVAGFPEFAPDACLINRYEPGARLSCIRTRMSGTSTSRLCRCHSVYLQSSYSAEKNARTRRRAFRLPTGMYWSGVVRRDCGTTG